MIPRFIDPISVSLLEGTRKELDRFRDPHEKISDFVRVAVSREIARRKQLAERRRQKLEAAE